MTSAFISSLKAHLQTHSHWGRASTQELGGLDSDILTLCFHLISFSSPSASAVLDVWTVFNSKERFYSTYLRNALIKGGGEDGEWEFWWRNTPWESRSRTLVLKYNRDSTQSWRISLLLLVQFHLEKKKKSDLDGEGTEALCLDSESSHF